ncbi:MAG: esterase [bacterium]|nr:MAG: esterase [bacterium]
MRYFYLHGFLSGPNSNKGKYLSGKFRDLGHELIRPDLNGGDFENLTISSQLQVVHDEIRSSADEAVLIGSSLGAFIAALSAEKYPQVEKLVLLAPALDFVNRYFNTLSQQEVSRWKESGYMSLYHYAYEKEMRLGYGMVKDAVKFKNIEFTRSISALLIHGIYDEVVPSAVSVKYLQENPRASLLFFPSDHSLGDQLENIWKYIMSFLGL